jgi:hypothetical protein
VLSSVKVEEGGILLVKVKKFIKVLFLQYTGAALQKFRETLCKTFLETFR